MRKLGLSLAALCLVGLATAVIGWRIFTDYLSAPTSTDRREPKVIDVPADLPGRDVAELLLKNGLIDRPGWLAAYLEHFHRAPVIKPGEYALSPNMSPAEIIDRLVRGGVVTHSIVVEPGTTARDVAAKLAEAGLATEAVVLQRVHDAQLAARLDLPGTVLEGYLFPDTYAFPKGTPPDEMLGRMVARYRERMTPELLDAARHNDLVEHQLVTMASLLERAPVPARERAQLAAVYRNRLKAGMPLESTASLGYAVGKSEEQLTPEDRDSDSPFNTHRHLGLPPSAICSPSLESLTAAANPAKIEALYWAPAGENAHVFCADEECHREALERAGLPPPPPPPKKKRR
ncbi:MAG: endolytic transglycosylase MltG [Deltaproteobacteria bacterium]|nr:endolytic transglycosylase MltG [Deltaproteobacteria bacterium]